MNDPITWRTTDLSRARVEYILGRDWVAKFFAMPRAKAIAAARSRGHGAWEANEREYHAAYRSLERLLAAKTARDPKRARLPGAFARVRRDDPYSGSEGFVRDVERQLRIGDRQVRFRNLSTLGGTRYDDVYVNYVNLPQGIGGASGGAEAENNRISFWVRGFDRTDPKAPAPRGKVKIETANSSLYKGGSFARENRIALRGRTGTPKQIAAYLASFLNRVAETVPPNLTHTGRDRKRTRLYR
jgi:hypothetical protein